MSSCRRHLGGGYARRDTLQVPDKGHLRPHRLAEIGLLREVFHDVEPLVDGHGILDGHGNPPLQHPPAHRREGPVDGFGETALFAGAVGSEKFQIADGELVYPHEIFLVEPRNRLDVCDVAVFGELQVVENGSGSRHAPGELVDAEAFERLGAELLAELFAVHFLRKDPFVELVGIEPRAESPGEPVLVTALEDDLLGREIGNQLVYIGVRTLGNIEFARRNIEKGDARELGSEENRRKVGVLLVGEDVVAHDHAGRDEFDDPALDQPLDRLGVFQLFADGYPFSGANQLGQVGVDGMIGKTGQFDERSRPVGPPRKRDAQNAAGLDGVFAESLVEVADPEQQHRIGMHRLDCIVLLHERGFHVLLVCFLFGSHNRILYINSIKQR